MLLIVTRLLCHLTNRFIVICDICSVRHTSTCHKRNNIAQRASITSNVLESPSIATRRHPLRLQAWIEALRNYNEHHSLGGSQQQQQKHILHLMWYFMDAWASRTKVHVYFIIDKSNYKDNNVYSYMFRLCIASNKTPRICNSPCNVTRDNCDNNCQYDASK